MDLRTRTKQLGANEKARRKMRDVKFFVYHEKSDLSEKSMRTGARKLLRTGLVPARAWRGTSRGHCADRKVGIEEADGSSRQGGIGVALTFHVSE